MSKKLVTVLGPTAVGKTKFAVELASDFNGEIISADSRQVYRYMDIGTGKDLEDYRIGDQIIKSYLIDVADPKEEFNLYRFTGEFRKAYKLITGKGRVPFLVGGTGMYLSAVIQDYKLNRAEFSTDNYNRLTELSTEELRDRLLKLRPKQHNITDIVDRERIIKAIIVAESSEVDDNKTVFDHLVIGIKLERDEIKKRITRRLKERLDRGMVDEVEKLIENGVSLDKLKLFGLEYKFICMYLNRELNYNDMYQKLNSAIHKFAKRQMTWFRKMEKEGVDIHWLEPGEYSKAVKLTGRFLNE